MKIKRLNKKSLMQDGGQQVEQQQAEQVQQQQMQQQQEMQQAGVSDLVESVRSAIEQGADIKQVIVELANQRIPTEDIQQALLAAGNDESDIMDAFSELESMQRQAAQEKAQQQPQQQMAQDGNEVSNEDMMSRDPSEEIAEEDKFQEQGGWQYRKDGDKYYTRKVGEDNWRQAEGDPLTNIKWKIYGEDEKAFREYEHKAKLAEAKKKMQQRQAAAKEKLSKTESSSGIPTKADILKGGYKVRLIEYPKGYTSPSGATMPPGHIESILVDSEGRPVSHYMDASNKKQEAFVNKWTDHDYNRGPNAGWGRHFRSKATLDKKLEEEGMRYADLSLNEDQMINYLYSAGLEDNQVYDFINNNCADGVCRAFGIDDKSVGKALPLFPGGTLTDPSMVFNTITKNFGVTPKGAPQVSRTQQVKDMANLLPKFIHSGNNPGVKTGLDLNHLIDFTGDLYKGTRDTYNYIDNDLGDDIQEGFYDVMEGAEDAYDRFGKWTGWYERGGAFNRDQRALLPKGRRSTINQFFGERDGYVSNPLSNYMPMDLGMKGDPINAANAFAESMSNLFSGQIDPETGLMSGAFRDNKAKRKRHKLSKADDYNYKITVDPNDPNYDPDKLNYSTSARDLYEASKNGTPLPTKKESAEDLIPRTSIKFNPESQKYETLVMPKDVDWDLYTNKGKGKVRGEYKKAMEEARSGMMDLSEFIGRGKNLSKEQREQLSQIGEDMDAFNASKDIPENTTFGVDESGQSVYYAPDAAPENNDEILNDIMMMNSNKPDWQNYNPTSFYNQRRFGGKAQPGTEVASNDTEFVPEVSQEQAAYDAAKAAYDEEMARVMAVRKKTSDLARQHGEAGASYSDVGISDNLANWINNTGYACNTYSCQIMREAGATIPEGTEPFEMNGRTYRPGDKLPIIPGNAQFNSYADKLGFELMPKGTMPTEEADLIRGHMYNQPGGASSGSQHSVISAGYGDDDTLDLYNNPGNVYSGYSLRRQDGSDPMATGEGNYYTDDSGVMRYVGATPTLKAKMMEAETALNKIREANAWQDPELNYSREKGGQPQQMIPMEPGMMEMYMPSNPMIEIAEGERKRLSEMEGQGNRRYRLALEELQKMAPGGAVDFPNPTDPPVPQPLKGKKRFHKFVKSDAMVGDTDYANIDRSGLSEDQLGIVDSAEFRMDPRSFRGQVPGNVMRTQRKANKAIMEPGQGFGISKPKNERYNWKLNAKLHRQDQDSDYARAREAGVTGDSLGDYGRKQSPDRLRTGRPYSPDRQWDGVKGNLQRIFTDKEYSGAWFPKKKIKETGGSAELDTETIAKLMALGAEIKYL
jgi:hypothetical protein